MVKELLTLVNIWTSYCQNKLGAFLWLTMQQLQQQQQKQYDKLSKWVLR